MTAVSATDAGKRSERSLTQRAGFTAAASMLLQIARIAITLLVVPLVLRGVGVESYGIWLVVQQSVGLLVVADLRATGTLKFTLAITQHDDDLSAKRRQIGASIAFWAMTLPLILVVTLAADWLLPHVIDVPTDLVATTRIVFLITMGAVMLDRLLSTPALVLRGMNLDYVGAWIDALMLFLGAVLGLVAVQAGLGLIGFVAGSMLGILIGDVVRGFVARRRLPWLGLERPTRAELRRFAGHSGWLALGDVSSLLLFGTELILVGAVAGATAAAVYGSTQFVVRTVCIPLVELLSSAGPGIARLVGEGRHERALEVRDQIIVLGLGAAAAVGGAVLVVNRAFVDVWVGGRLFGGTTLNTVLVALAVVTILVRLDSFVVDVCLGFRGRSTLTLVGGVVGLTAGALLGVHSGAVGAAIGLLIGRFVTLCGLPVLVARATGSRIAEVVRPMLRPVGATVLVLVAAGIVGRSVSPPSTWASVLVFGAVSAMATGGAYAFLAASRAARRDVIQRLLMVAGRGPRGVTAPVPDPSVNEFQNWMPEARSA